MTLAEIAELAGVSTATVSWALSGKRPVAPETRRRILEIARKTGYEVHGPARALATGRRHTIGFISGFFGHLHTGAPNMEFLSGLVGALDKRSYRTMVFAAEPGAQSLQATIRQSLVDGVVLSMAWSPEIVRALQELKIAVVAAMPIFDAPPCTCVEPDDRGGARTATEYLLSLGHRRIAFVGAVTENARYVQRERFGGFLDVMSQAALPVNPFADRFRPPEETIADLFEGEGSPTALVCFDDDIAMLAINCLADRGRRVPEDVSLIAFNDLPRTALAHPPLTTMKIPFDEIGRIAARLILDRVENADIDARRVLVPTELVVRRSTAPASRTAVVERSQSMKHK